MKKALVARCGALGDMIIVSPVFSALKRAGYYVICYTGARGMQVLKNNPNIDEFIEYTKEKEYNPNFVQDILDLKNNINPDWYKDFSESIEVNVALHPSSPAYIYPKKERNLRGNKNYYDVTADWAGLDLKNAGDKILPEIYLEESEIANVHKYLRKGSVNILWSLSGSGSNKVYPWTDYIMGELIRNYPNIHFLTVGDQKCQILEWYADDMIKEHATNLAGQIEFRESMALTSIVDLVISPDTGLLHASGAFNTPKIGILGHTTVENITKYFNHDYSLNADEELCECSPCHRLIYDHKIQCPIENLTGAAWCMSDGQPAIRLYDQIVKALHENGRITERIAAGRSPEEVMSSLQPANV